MEALAAAILLVWVCIPTIVGGLDIHEELGKGIKGGESAIKYFNALLLLMGLI